MLEEETPQDIDFVHLNLQSAKS